MEVARLHLNEFIQSIRTKTELLESSKQELASLRKQVAALDNSPNLNNLTKAVILTEKDWREFRHLFEKVHHGFFERLEQKMPNLTESETRLLTLYRLELSNKEMASMLGVGTSAVRSLKSRMKPKLNLEKDQTIEQLVHAI